MGIKLLIADVDGTLVTKSKVLTQRTIDAVDRLRAAGVGFAITSGRPPRGMAKLVGPLKLTTAVAAFNGGMYVMPDLTTVLAQRTIAPAVARQVLDYLLGEGLNVYVYQGSDWFLRDASAPHVARESSNVGFAPIVTDDLYAVLDAPVKIVGVSDDLPRVARCEAELGALVGAEACAARSQPYYLDVTHPEANKGMVVREASRILGIPIEEIATIGDMPNDVSMLTTAGLGIAMGNAPPEVQRIARHVTGTNEAEGFADAVDSFILGEPPIAHTALGLPPRVRACLFGLDGVLTQMAGLHAEAWKQLFDHYLRRRAQALGQPFVPFDAIEEYRRQFHGRASQDGVRTFLVSRGIQLPEQTIQALVEKKGQILAEMVGREQVETYEGSVRYLQAARAAGLRTAVVSSSTHCMEVLVSAGIVDLFDSWIDGGFAVANHLGARPAPDVYLAAAQALGVDSEQAVVMEDELAGMEAGRAGHFGYVVGIDRVGRGPELRNHGADVVVPDLSALLEPVAAVSA
jgi:Cof subfamily protein (haloacid dehalogenase superfamily)/HAD superfamily hydrolase (TIGR01509 family)